MSEQSTVPTVNYKPIEGFPGYRVGDDGSVWSCWARNGKSILSDRWRRLKLVPNRNGHLTVSLRRNRKPLTRYVHRLVLQAFVGPSPDGLHCCHNDGNPANNLLHNLRWDTPLSNSRDCAKHGNRLFGESNPQSVLTSDGVREIRRRVRSGESSVELAKEYGVDHVTIRRAARGASWGHVVNDE